MLNSIVKLIKNYPIIATSSVLLSIYIAYKCTVKCEPTIIDGDCVAFSSKPIRIFLNF